MVIVTHDVSPDKIGNMDTIPYASKMLLVFIFAMHIISDVGAGESWRDVLFEFEDVKYVEEDGVGYFDITIPEEYQSEGVSTVRVTLDCKKAVIVGENAGGYSNFLKEIKTKRILKLQSVRLMLSGN